MTIRRNLVSGWEHDRLRPPALGRNGSEPRRDAGGDSPGRGRGGAAPTSFDTFLSHPSWSPDGAELVIGSYDLGNIRSTPNPSNLYAINPDGTGLRQLTQSSTDGHMRIGTPRWDPNGSRIVVSVLYSTGPDFEFGGDVRLAFVDAAGGEPELISSRAGNTRICAQRPDAIVCPRVRDPQPHAASHRRGRDQAGRITLRPLPAAAAARRWSYVTNARRSEPSCSALAR